MIYKFSAKNFYSFKDNVEVSFEVNEKAPDTSTYAKGLNSNRVSKILSVIGPNASGKTNLLKILPFLHFLIVDSFTDLKPDEKLPFDSYKFMSNNKLSTELSVTFACKDSLFDYFIKINQYQILEEKLRQYNVATKQFKTLYTRTWKEDKKEYSLSFKNFAASIKLKDIVAKRKNATVISTAAQIEHKLSKEIIDCWNEFTFNVIQHGKHDHSEEWMYSSAKYYYDHPEMMKKAEKLITKFDLGLTKLTIEKHILKSKTGKEETLYLPIGFHKGAEKEYPLVFHYESQGTKSLFVILRRILEVLEVGGVAILDEFDADLHPLMLPELINMFASKFFNPKNAQLIFTTHHHGILSKLDKYQIVLVEKNSENSKVEVFRLDEVKGIRADDNYYSKYIAGAYGAVPEI